MTRIPALVFVAIETPGEIVHDHYLRGGRGLCRYVATLGDGALRVMVAKEPAGPQGQIITHVSASVGRDSRDVTPPFRRPSNFEMEEITSALFSLLRFEETSGNDPCVRHLWEVIDADA